jgi:hypothetical protein
LTVENPDYKAIPYIIYDLNGTKRLSGIMEYGRIDISGLCPGLYILELNRTQKIKLIKQ